jgi:uncharacterized SAM-binding protein YcdF (DUF218 family)
MYRAKRLFQKEGFNVIPYKFDYKAAGINKSKLMNFLPNANNLELTETGIREIIGRLFYLVKD